jgi:hypothetical protein
MSEFENVKSILEGQGDWFTANLFRLIAKADNNNRAKLFKAFPDEVDAVHKYLTGKDYEGCAMNKTKIVSYDFLIDNIIAVKAPAGTDPDTLIDQALEQLIQRCHQHGEINFIFDKVFDPETGSQLPAALDDDEWAAIKAKGLRYHGNSRDMR